MEVKSIYLDLQKAEKKKNWKKSVWVLESEAFKDPLELQIGYEDKELEQFNHRIDELKTDLNNKDSKIHELNSKLEAQSMVIQDLDKADAHTEVCIAKLQTQMDKKDEEINSLYKTIADLKTTVETLSGTILHLQEWVKLINQKLTKQPMVYSDKTFISGRERTGLWVLEMQCWEYLVIWKYVVGEHNEFVENQNNILFEKVTVDNNYYVPYYQLIGWTELDTPTATIYWDLVFIPC